MAVASKNERRPAGGAGSTEVGTSAGLAPPDKTLPIVGSFVAHYTALNASSTGLVTQSTVAQAKFGRFGEVHGIIHRDPGGTADSPIKFRGIYDVQQDTDLGTISGYAYFDLLTPTNRVFRRQQLFIVKRNDAEIFFMLAGSFVPATAAPDTVFNKVDTGVSVEGVFYKTG